MLGCTDGVAILSAKFAMSDGRVQGVAACYACPYFLSAMRMLRCLKRRLDCPMLYAGDMNMVPEASYRVGERALRKVDLAFGEFLGWGAEAGIGGEHVDLRLREGEFTRVQYGPQREGTSTIDWLISVGDRSGRWEGRGHGWCMLERTLN